MWIKKIKELYGQKHGIPIQGNIYLVLPLKKNIKKAHASKLLRNKFLYLGSRDNAEEEKESKNEKEGYGKENEGQEIFDGEASVSGSVTSSQSSRTSDSNVVKEFKASLYERKYPRTVTMLKYTLWLLICLLLTVSIVEWVITYQKIDDNVNFFDLDTHITSRLDMITMIALFARTTDLLLEYYYSIFNSLSGQEDIIFYGKDNFQYTHSLVFS